MPLEGKYEPSPQQWVRDQVERYERPAGARATPCATAACPVVIFSTRGAKSGNVRKQPLMRVEHDGAYLMVGSQGGAPTDPAWVANLRAGPDQVTVQDGPEPWDGVARELDGDGAGRVVGPRRGGVPRLRRLPEEDRPRGSRSSWSSAAELGSARQLALQLDRVLVGRWRAAAASAAARSWRRSRSR